uniref:uncharacterized protein LOC101300156 isoform X2 n=1 Tax=Fragaria vesca subsp. vesca TaxID=101020 RepID=UPI0005CAF1E1|nr:PREDICTED: uncharacterized protein LOC101300156 isoform X2 [Fragaria vesca subsp. vesca]
METFNPTGVSMLLTIDTTRNRVLFAETSKEAVDFLFTLLSLPVATVISLLSGDGMVGCIGNLYESVQDLGDTHLEPNFNKDMLLKPKATVVGADILGVNNNVCKSCSCHFPGSVCPLCECAVSTTAASTGEAPCSNGGYVKGGVVFVIMDNLVVKPMSTVSILDVLKELNVMEVDALEQKLGLKLVKASLESNAVLSSAFLGNAIGTPGQSRTHTDGLEAEIQGEYVALSEFIGLNRVEQADVFDENWKNEEKKWNKYGKYKALKKLRNTRTRRC